MPNIKVQCCALLILLVVAIFYFRLPRMMAATKRAYSRLLILCSICVITDILSVFAIVYADVLPEFLVVIACKLYLFLMISVIYQKIMYVCSDIFKNTVILKKKRFFYFSTLIITCILLVILPIYHVCEQNGNIVYTNGPATLVVYLYFTFVFFSIIYYIIANKGRINPRRGTAVSIWLVIWFFSALLQFMFSSLLLVSFGGSIGVLIIFFMIENPELSLDRESNFFSISALRSYIDELYGDNKSFMLISTLYRNDDAEFYKSLNNKYMFSSGTEIYILYFDAAEFEKAINLISGQFFNQLIYVVRDCSIAKSYPELRALMKGAYSINSTLIDNPDVVYEINDELNVKLKTRFAAENLIKDAIENDRVEVYYQPIFDIKSNRFYCAEALVRIMDRDGHIVPPGEFIPVAEQEGSIIALGKIIFEKVCNFLEYVDTDELGLQYIEVNLSVVQAADKELIPYIKSILEKHHIDARKINLEITESASSSSRKQLLKTMETLCEYGIGFSLDDFGTGQSNLDYMASMPVALVKFDRTMIQDYFVNSKSKNIMDACISMIHKLGLKIVAEGIETSEQFECMKQQDIDYIQGYYFSRPLPEAEFINFMKSNQQ